MGRIKTQMIKRLTFQLLKEHDGKFKNNFDDNKVIVESYLGTSSKKIRNIVAGYVTRQVKRRDEA
jgi:small subunit ribosomal protein S17e